MAYRGDRERARAAEAKTTGLVADLVRQFADPYAFLRELVQNGVDAGATGIEVRVDVDGDVASFSVEDDGAGMTRAIVEGPLLTVFSTSKEGDGTKIGKYGVGFVSVLALEPEEVLVETWREGESWLVRLGVDHRYELEAAAPRAGSGTVVTLRKRVGPGEIDEHVARCRRALARWCRHASVPIHVTTPDPDGGTARARVDAPFGLAARVTVEDRTGGEVVMVGPIAGAAPGEGDRPASACGFYNRGLLLHETTEPPARALAGLEVKIASAELAHTLSRDDVRRDAAYERVVAKAVGLVPRLREAVAKALERAAGEAAAGGDAGAFAGLLEAAVAAPIALGHGELVLPLTDRVDGLAAMPLVEILARRDGDARGMLVAAAPSRLTGALARAGRPVVRAAHPGLASGIVGVPASAPERVWAVVDEVRGADEDEALAAAVRRALVAAGVEVDRVVVGRLEGAEASRPAIALPGRAGQALVRVAMATRWWRRLGTIERLVLVAGHPTVERARARAAGDAFTAGHLLARALYVAERGALGEGPNERLLEDAAKALAPAARGRA